MGERTQDHSLAKPRNVSITRVAREAGVSIATVSRVLNTPEKVAASTAERVQRAIDKLGYRPNRFAKSLVTRKSGLLGISLPDLHGEFYSELMRRADEHAQSLGYHLLVSSSHHGAWSGTSALDLVDGLVAMVTEEEDPAIKALTRLHAPAVLLGMDGSDAGLDSVTIDQASGTREAVAHLLAAVPREKIHFVGGHKGNIDSDLRCEAFRAAMRSHGAELSPGQIAHGEFTFEWGWRWATERLGEGTLRGSGVLAANDEIAAGILDAARDDGLSVPRELRVVGFDNSNISRLLRPTISSVAVPIGEAVAAAVDLLAARVASPAGKAVCKRLETRLVIRQSSSTEETDA